MKLNLKVFNSRKKKISIEESIKCKIPIKDNDDRWNTEIEFEIPERLILQLIEELIDNIVEKQLYYGTDNAVKTLLRNMSFDEINNLIRPARAWRKINIIITNEGFQTSRFTRLSLFENLVNITEMKRRVEDKLHDISQSKLNFEKKITIDEKLKSPTV